MKHAFYSGSVPVFLLIMGICLSAEAGLFGFGGDSWREEVLLHDGGKIIVKRSQTYGGRHEIGQPDPIKEQTISFTLPSSNATIKWTSEYSEDVGRANFNLLALHILNGTPYIVAEPNLCLSYNKWGRPNPPYVIFKYGGKEWQRIQMSELPAVFKTVNLDFGMPWDIRDRKVKFDKGDLLTAETIKRNNDRNSQPNYREILRSELPNGNDCPMPTNARAEPIGPVINGKVLYYNWWPLAKEWLKNELSD